MSPSTILAVDAMGGDHAPAAICAGLEIACERHPQAQFMIFGNEEAIAPLIARTKRLKNQSSLLGCADIVSGDMKPTVALRLRDSSMRRAIDAVLKGDIFISPRFGPDVLSNLHSRSGSLNRKRAELTDRQRQILQLLIDGRSNKEAASALNLSVKTIEFHRAQMMAKLGARTGAELTKLAIQQGIVPE